MANINNHNQPHTLIIPLPAQGHHLPPPPPPHLLNFTHLLSHRFNLPITIAVTSLNLPFLSSSPSIQPLFLNFPNYPYLPPTSKTPKISPFPFLLHPPHACPFSPPPPNPHLGPQHLAPTQFTAIISDFFCGLTHHLVCDLGIPRITTSPPPPTPFPSNSNLNTPNNPPSIHTHPFLDPTILHHLSFLSSSFPIKPQPHFPTFSFECTN